MSPSPTLFCRGLIPCTPQPTPGPHGLTQAELDHMSAAFTNVMSVFLVLGLLGLVIVISLAVLLAVRS